MADKKQPFDNKKGNKELDSDDFGLSDEEFDFDEDIFFDDEDDTDSDSNDYMEESVDEEDHEDEEDEGFMSDTSSIVTTDDDIDEEDLDESTLEPFDQVSSGGFLANLRIKLEQFIEKIKNESPKQQLKYGIFALVGLVLLLFLLIRLFSGGEQQAKPQVTASKKLTTQQILDNSSVAENQSDSVTPVNGGNTEELAQTNSSPVIPVSIGDLQPSSAVSLPPSSTGASSGMPNSFPQADEAAVSNATAASDVSAIKKSNSALSKKIDGLQEQVQELNSQLSAADQMNNSNQAQIATLIQSINNIQAQIVKLNNAIQLIANAAGPSRSSNDGFVNPNQPTNVADASNDYYVQAVIPGRAWLKSSNGQILTVTKGDPVPGYGKVVNIDSQNGFVTTSTGVKFVFGIDASQ